VDVQRFVKLKGEGTVPDRKERTKEAALRPESSKEEEKKRRNQSR
jgi:hypothetical protein